MLYLILGNIIGGFGLLFNWYALKQSDIVLFKRYNAYCSALLACSYYFLGGYTASVIILIIFARQYIGSYASELNKNTVLILCTLFTILALISTYYTWKNYMSLFPMFATLMSTVAYFYATQYQLRCTTFVSTLLWIVYALYIHSIFHTVGCLMGLFVGYQELKKYKQEELKII